MRSLKSFICTAVVCGFSHGFAQTPTPSPAPEASPSASPALDVTMPPVPSALPEPSGTPTAPGAGQGSLFPDAGSVSAPGSAGGFQDLLQGAGHAAPLIRKSTTSTSLQSLQDKINYRKAKTIATNEPKFQQELATAWAQPTEPEFRSDLRIYYQHLHDRIVVIEPSCKSYADTVLTTNLQYLSQKRLRTTSAEEVRAARAGH
jgi:hypothetical protein